MKKSVKSLLILTLCAGFFTVGFYYFLIWSTWDYEADFLQADACLDNGGVWSRTGYDAPRCWHAGQCEDQDGQWSAQLKQCVKN